jgi:serine/threonine-protein kinase RsbW
VRSAASSNGNGRVQVIRLTIPAKPEYIALGRLALAGISRLRDEPLSAEDLGDLKLALTEACTNSVRHAYAGDADAHGTVEIVYELHQDRLVVEVADTGVGFGAENGSGEHAISANGGDLSEGGLGIAIIKALADEFELDTGAEGGSRLRFAKRLQS